MSGTNFKTERGILTFFDFDQFGLYQILQKKDPVLIEQDLARVFTGLKDWVGSRTVEKSVPWGTDNNRRTKAFCKNLSYNESTGDYLFVIWKTLGDNKGDIQGIEAGTKIDENNDNVVSASETQDGKNYIWGLPCYYWVLPEYKKVASIRFPSSYADTDLFCQYIKAYVDYRLEDPSKIVHDIEFSRANSPEPSKFKRVFYEKDKKSLVFKVSTKKTRRITRGANIEKLCKKITHIVYHDVIETNVEDTRNQWQKLFDKVGNIISGSSPVVSKKHKVELIVEGTPTKEEFEKLIEDYLDQHNIDDEDDKDSGDSIKKPDQVRIGFKINGKSSAITWLDEYVLRHEIHTNLENRYKHYSSSYLLSIVNAHRNDLVSYLDDPEPSNDTQSTVDFSSADNDDDGTLKEVGA
ncbi:hypothetical protein QE445_001998 [Pantoea ananatis]|uniref:hypothetical protein n=1 Tax=Pantoea ananas TaxID=553 RepID=UPI002865C737|nr:hypothetical protein [Pantoea ananatis]MDR6090064.1 hypothetical protein [Pantoea ananatis]